MEYIINVGLCTSAQYAHTVPAGTLLPTSYVYAQLHAHGLTIVSARVLQSTTEPTLVARVRSTRHSSYARIRGALRDVATACQQDCIAIVPVTDGRLLHSAGLLVGGYAHLWGAYNADYFLSEGV